MSSFVCEKDKDIEYFLHEKAAEFERLSKSRTYLICDEEELISGNKNSPLKIYGYISIALKVLSVPETLSNRKRREIDGLSAKIHGTQIVDFPCYLIGQLSKNSNIENNEINGKQLIDMALSIIVASVEAVGGRYVMIECRENEKLLKFYENNFFNEIARIPDNEQPMIQMIRKIV